MKRPHCDDEVAGWNGGGSSSVLVVPQSLTRASEDLAGLDPVFAELVGRHGPPRFRRRPRVAERFEAVARSVAYQQLAGRAAAVIWGRAQTAVGAPFTARQVLATSPDDLRAAGLSAAKAAAIFDLADQVTSARIDFSGMGYQSDEEVIASLIQVRGVGRWTAQMFLMFSLRRLDVWPTGDLGVRVGYGFAHEFDEAPTAVELEPLGESLRPYRSVAAWYCWREVEARRSFEEG